MEVSGTLASFSSLLQPFLAFLSDDPVLRVLQGILVGSAFLLTFLIFYATRDILHRSTSFAAQFWCIVLVAALPIGGFLLYLLVRPSRTLHERHMEKMLSEISALLLPLQEQVLSPRERTDEAKRTLIAAAALAHSAETIPTIAEKTTIESSITQETASPLT